VRSKCGPSTPESADRPRVGHHPRRRGHFANRRRPDRSRRRGPRARVAAPAADETAPLTDVSASDAWRQYRQPPRLFRFLHRKAAARQFERRPDGPRAFAVVGHSWVVHTRRTRPAEHREAVVVHCCCPCTVVGPGPDDAAKRPADGCCYTGRSSGLRQSHEDHQAHAREARPGCVPVQSPLSVCVRARYCRPLS